MADDDTRPDYGPAGCFRPSAIAMIGALSVLGWGVVFLIVQLGRWVF